MDELRRAILRASYASQTPVAVCERPPVEEPIQEPEVQPEPQIEVDNYKIPDEPPPAYYPSIASIVRLVCDRYKVSRVDLVSDRRHMGIVRPRQIVMALARSLTLQTMPAIAKHLGKRDHTTIIHGVRKIAKLRAADPKFDAEIRALESELRGT